MASSSTTSISPETLQAHKDRAAADIMAHRDRLISLSHDIHARPELAFNEYYAADRLAQELEEGGFTVTRGAYGVDTSVEGVYGTGPMRVVICAEYDALPGIGHACGHNMIAAAGLGAGIGLTALADELGIQIVVLGTPAEEGGGGKITLLRNGAWEGAACSLMVHALAQEDEVSPLVTTMQCIERFEATFTGRSAHAVIAPQEAINAGAAAIIAQVALGLLRQQLVDGVRLSAITAEAGTVTNIIPDLARIMIELRSPELDDVIEAKKHVLACMEGAAIATGCSWSHKRTQPRYVTILPDPALAAAWDANMERTGRPVTANRPITRPSTDMGNVSRVVPSIHPHICIKGSTTPTHTVEFAAAAASEAGDTAVLDGATVMAWTIIDLATDPKTRTNLLRGASGRIPGATTIDHGDG